MNKKVLYGVAASALLFTIILLMRPSDSGISSNQPGKLDTFVQCLKNKGVKFYGAFWCPHCQAQKKLFGSSAKLLPYVECSTPDSQGQTLTCKEKKIEGYPTWEFSDGSRKNGEMTLDELSASSSCPLLLSDNTDVVSTTQK